MFVVNLDLIVSSVNFLFFRDYEGVSKYVVVGDDWGRVYVFLRNGDVLVEFYILFDLLVIVMFFYMLVYMNESILVIGYSDGLILVYRFWEIFVGEDLSFFYMENLVVLDLREIGLIGFLILILEVYYVRRFRYILSVDESGKINVFRENGILYGLVVFISRFLVFLK